MHQKSSDALLFTSVRVCNTGKGHQGDKMFSALIASQSVVLFFLSAVIHKFDYVFAENGTVQYKEGKLVSKQVCLDPESIQISYML